MATRGATLVELEPMRAEVLDVRRRAEPVAIRSPVAGQVLKIARKSESTVTVGQPLIEIGDPRVLEVGQWPWRADLVRHQSGGTGNCPSG